MCRSSIAKKSLKAAMLPQKIHFKNPFNLIYDHFNKRVLIYFKERHRSKVGKKLISEVTEPRTVFMNQKCEKLLMTEI